MDYRERSVFDFRPNFEAIEHGQLDDHSFDATAGGVAVPWKVTSLPRRTLTLPFKIDGYENLKPFRAFISSVNGSQKGFWVPTWLTDYLLVENIAAGASEITIQNVSVASKLAFSDQFRHLALIDREKIELYRIETTLVDGTFETITIDPVTASAFSARSTVCCGVMFARLADEEIEYVHESSAVAKVDLKFIELPTETEGTPHLGTAPAKLYLIQQGTAVWRFTDWPVDIEIDGTVWQAAAIEHDEITQNIDFANDGFGLSMATDSALHPLRNLLDPAFIQETTLTIYEVDASAPVAIGPVRFKGRIERPRFPGKGIIQAPVSSLLRIAEIQGPQAILERTCQHRTYDGGCKLNALDWTTSGEITAISASPAYIEAVEFGDKATAEADPNWFALGLVTVGTEQRQCVGQDGNRLYLNAPFRSAEVGQTAAALAGDDLSIETCHAKFDNVVNHFGFKYMPNKNPQFEMLETPKPSGGKK